MTMQLSGIEQAAIERLVSFANYNYGERRSEPRTSMQVPAWIEFLGEDRQRIEGPSVALIQDVSPSGVGLICEEVPAPSYPYVYVDASESYSIEGLVEIVRWERCDGYCSLGGRFVE